MLFRSRRWGDQIPGMSVAFQFRGIGLCVELIFWTPITGVKSARVPKPGRKGKVVAAWPICLLHPETSVLERKEGTAVSGFKLSSVMSSRYPLIVIVPILQ
ncbi:hypothetical protein ONS95_011469 [Cadophora gregata]|uniref:uncharacterized protein n=1 Tax=Cadophora gregata TaxID=51156 RepID=UPI0026DBC18E|nr:uncharacterized protein ONS95_011469 [Cadophora gregata]KAK0120056.1 hypothetical protein ONS95_011469 [Cadophora gregata]